MFERILICLFLSCLISCSEDTKVTYVTEIEPILVNHCYDCHGDGVDKGDIELDHHASTVKLMEDRALWESVYANIDTQLMPPANKTPLNDAERTKVLTWIEDDIFKLDRDNPDPGKPVIRRLNRSEYNHAIRDLFGLDLKPADQFPEDDTGYGFDNIGEVLTLSPALFERYLKAAETIMDRVIPTEPVKPRQTRYSNDTFVRRAGNPSGGAMASSGTIGVQFTPPKDGLYHIKVIAKGSQAKQEWPIMRVKIESGLQKDIRVNSRNYKDFLVTCRLKSDHKKRWIELSFINDHYDPKAKDPQQRDRNLYIERIEVSGPIETKPPSPPAVYQEWMKLTKGLDRDTDKAREILTQTAFLAWRRPPAEEDIKRLTALYETARKDDLSFDESLKFAMKAILLSQRFLFRGETESARGKAGSYTLVDEFTLASRLSFFLWSSIPDKELLDLAARGRLRKELPGQIKRMMRDGKSDALTTNFAGQWLQLRNLQLASPDPKRFRGWNDSLRKSMQLETELFFSYIAKENRSVLEFLNADYSFLDRRLADHYQIKGRVKSDRFEKVMFSGRDYERRGGLLAHASILTITSDPTRTSPVNRGNYVLENIMGTIPPPTPEDLEIPALEEAKGEKNNLSLRQQLEIHREDKRCAGCHARMDPIGFALENFDGYGQWRDQDNGQSIDTKGKLYTGESFEGMTGLRTLLVEQKSEAFLKCLAEKLLTYGLGRGVEYYDKPALNEIVRRTVENDYRFQEMILAIAESVPFQKTRVISKSAPE